MSNKINKYKTHDKQPLTDIIYNCAPSANPNRDNNKAEKIWYKRHIINVFKKTISNEILLILFGSFSKAKKNYNNNSDIDIAVYLGRHLTGKEWLEINGELEKLPILRDIDVVDIAKLTNIELLNHIVNEGDIWINSKSLFQDLKKHLKNIKKS